MPMLTVERLNELKRMFSMFMDSMKAETFVVQYLGEELGWDRQYRSVNFVADVSVFMDFHNNNGSIQHLTQKFLLYVNEHAPNRDDLIESISEILRELRGVRKLSIFVSAYDLDNDLPVIKEVRAHYSRNYSLYEFMMAEGNLSPRERAEMLDQADAFAAIITTNYAESNMLTDEFDKMVDLAKRMSGDQGPRFIVHPTDAQARDFWGRKEIELNILGDSRFRCLDIPEVGKPDLPKPRDIFPSIIDPQKTDADHPQYVVTLGEPKAEMDNGLARHVGRLRAKLREHAVPTEHWDDGWRDVRGERDILERRPVFVRSIADSTATVADVNPKLASQLKEHFAWAYDDPDPPELSRCLKILWRPGGPPWGPSHQEHPDSLRTEVAEDLASHLARLVNRNEAIQNIINWEAPVEHTASAKSIIAAVERCLKDIGGDPEPVRQMFTKKDNLAEKLIPLLGSFRPIIAITDIEEPVDPKKALERMRTFEERLPTEMKAANSNLLCVAILIRNAGFFLGEEISGFGLSKPWPIVRIRRENDAYSPDPASVDFVKRRVAGGR